ncbi:MAG: hypothetical protein U5R31_10825 [Acidimicrobiia bacterium]|nr:hypothetical protein [Acidimicrobiia bacterium]
MSTNRSTWAAASGWLWYRQPPATFTSWKPRLLLVLVGERPAQLLDVVGRQLGDLGEQVRLDRPLGHHDDGFDRG